MSRKLAILLPMLAVGVALDQLTKFLVIQALPLGTQIPVIRGFFNLVHIRNRGAAFGLLANLSPHFAWGFFLATTTLVLAVVAYLWWRLSEKDTLASFGYGLIFTGALGNLLDRLRLGEVIDFLDFHLGRYHWPAFNLADTLVCLGAGLLVWAILQKDQSPDVSHSL
jgi:signal peptidase II|uniref:Lipoprotein signal peptidase n=1 Tax=Desulfobacca acetoxidans TaxID=60893 RepID=A0A7C5AL00_9BACT